MKKQKGRRQKTRGKKANKGDINVSQSKSKTQNNELECPKIGCLGCGNPLNER